MKAIPKSHQPQPMESMGITQPELTQSLGVAVPKMKIRQLRESIGLTQLGLSQLVGVTEASIQNWENGRTGLEPIQRVIKLCQVLKCKAEDLIEYHENSFELKPIQTKPIGGEALPETVHRCDISLTSKEIERLEVIAEAYKCTSEGKGLISALLTKIARDELLITPPTPILYPCPYKYKIVPLEKGKKAILRNFDVIKKFSLTQWVASTKPLHPVYNKRHGVRGKDEENKEEILNLYKKLPIHIGEDYVVLSVSSTPNEDDPEQIKFDTKFILFSEKHERLPPGAIKIFLIDEQGNEMCYDDSQEIMKQESNGNPYVNFTVTHGLEKVFIKIIVGDRVFLETFGVN